MSDTCGLGKWFCANVEVWKLAASLLTPGIAASFAFWIARSGVLTDKAKTLNQELIKQRMIVYKEVAPHVNGTYCYLMFIGPWKSMTPEEVLSFKRSADHEMHIYRALFSEDLFVAYRAFIQCSFVENSLRGEAAKIRLNSSFARSLWQDDWKENWEAKLDDKQAPPRELDRNYATFMMAFAKELGVEGEPWRVIPRSPELRPPDPFTGGLPPDLGLRGAPSDSAQQSLIETFEPQIFAEAVSKQSRYRIRSWERRSRIR